MFWDQHIPLFTVAALRAFIGQSRTPHADDAFRRAQHAQQIVEQHRRARLTCPKIKLQTFLRLARRLRFPAF